MGREQPDTHQPSAREKKEAIRFLRFQQRVSGRYNEGLQERTNRLIRQNTLWGKRVEVHGSVPFTFTGTLEPFRETVTDPEASSYVVLRFGPKDSIRIPKAAIIALAEV